MWRHLMIVSVLFGVVAGCGGGEDDGGEDRCRTALVARALAGDDQAMVDRFTDEARAVCTAAQLELEGIDG